MLGLVLQTIIVTLSDPTDPTIKLHKLYKKSVADYGAKQTD